MDGEALPSSVTSVLGKRTAEAPEEAIRRMSDQIGQISGQVVAFVRWKMQVDRRLQALEDDAWGNDGGVGPAPASSSQGVVSRPSIPNHDGSSDPADWIKWIQKLLRYDPTASEEEVPEMVAAILSGDAHPWFETTEKYTWATLQMALCLGFGSGGMEEPLKAMSKLKQTGPVEDYQQHFELFSSSCAAVKKRVLFGMYMSGLKEEVRNELRLTGLEDLPDLFEKAMVAEEESLRKIRCGPSAGESEMGYPKVYIRKKRNFSDSDSIPLEALGLIFLWLPLKPLFRCKAVCKDWKFIVTDPDFVIKYRSYSSRPRYVGYFHRNLNHSSDSSYLGFTTDGENHNGGFFSVKEALSVFDRRHCPWHPHIEIIGSSNGFLLCRSIEPLIHLGCYSVPESGYYICNPLTKEWRALPLSPRWDTPGVVGFTFKEGEGEGEGGYEFFVVRFLVVSSEYLKDWDTEVETYSSKSGKWSSKRPVAGASYFATPEMNDGVAVEIGGLFYWTMENWDHVLCYNPATCELDKVPAPNEVKNTEMLHTRNRDKHREMNQSFFIGDDGSIGILCRMQDSEGFEVWIHGEGKPGTWRMMHRVERANLMSLEDLSAFVFSDLKLQSFVVNPQKMLISVPTGLNFAYDLKSGVLERIPDDLKDHLIGLPDGYRLYHLPSWVFRI